MTCQTTVFHLHATHQQISYFNPVLSSRVISAYSFTVNDEFSLFQQLNERSHIPVLNSISWHLFVGGISRQVLNASTGISKLGACVRTFTLQIPIVF